MHKFWYHSPVRFYKTEEELSDMTNPQNCQFFGAKNPYPLEKGEIHRFLIPNVDNGVVNPNNFIGRNLLLNTDFKENINYWLSSGNGENLSWYNFDGIKALLLDSENSQNGAVVYTHRISDLEKNIDYTLSFDIRPAFQAYSVKLRTGMNEATEEINIHTTQEFKRYSVTIKPTNNSYYLLFQTVGGEQSYLIKNVKLEKGTVATAWSPAHEDEDYETNLKLFLVGDTEQEIQSLMTVIDDKLYAVTFKCDDFIQGHFEIRNYSEPIFYSNCVKFIDSTDSDGRKYIKIATKHNYDKNLFPYSKSHNLYCVTNLPAYDLGRFTTEVDAKNNRVGNSASLISSESYTDEVVQYEFKAYGDANILSFIQVHAVNNEFYINGTQRTAIDKMEADEFAILGKLKFTNVKSNLGLNKTINEGDIFSELQMQIIEKYPIDNYIDQASFYNGEIGCKFNSTVYGTGDLTKKMRLFKNGIEILSKNYNQLELFGNIVSFRFAISGLSPGNYVVKIDKGMFKNSFGNVFQGITNNTDWNFTLVEEIIPAISISWEDGTNTDLSGTLNNITLKIKSETYSALNPIINYSWESSTDGIPYTQFGIGNSDKTVSLVPNNNFYRVKATLQNTTEIYSNVLKYTKEAISTNDYYFKATRPFNYPGNDFVRYIDQYGNEQTEILIRSYWEETIDENGIILLGEWFEAPCTLIVANSILEVVGAVTCTP